MASSATPVKAPPAASGAVLSAAGLAATNAAWRRGVALTGEDARRALRPDMASPFTSLGDAVARLLPYHVRSAQRTLQAHGARCLLARCADVAAARQVFGAEEGDEADVDEAGEPLPPRGHTRLRRTA